MEKCIIVAIADNLAIGRDNALLWHISDDLKYFRRTTMGCPVIMGRRTFESIGRALPGRLNVVVSRTLTGEDLPDGVVAASSLEDAYAAAEASGAEKCFVIGGGKVYASAMASADSLYVTHVHTVVPDADTFFPEIDPALWERTDTAERLLDEPSGTEFEFAVYRRLA